MKKPTYKQQDATNAEVLELLTNVCMETSGIVTSSGGVLELYEEEALIIGGLTMVLLARRSGLFSEEADPAFAIDAYKKLIEDSVDGPYTFRYREFKE